MQSSFCKLKQTLQTVSSRAYATAPSALDRTQAIALLKTQPSHYVVAQLHQRLYLLTANDLLTVPRIKSDLKPGDRIQLSRILEIGSRDFTLRASQVREKGAERACLSNEDVQVFATVEEHVKSKMERIEKFKRRHRYHRLLKSKPQWTRLRINTIQIGNGLGKADVDRKVEAASGSN